MSCTGRPARRAASPSSRSSSTDSSLCVHVSAGTSSASASPNAAASVRMRSTAPTLSAAYAAAASAPCSRSIRAYRGDCNAVAFALVCPVAPLPTRPASSSTTSIPSCARSAARVTPTIPPPTTTTSAEVSPRNGSTAPSSPPCHHKERGDTGACGKVKLPLGGHHLHPPNPTVQHQIPRHPTYLPPHRWESAHASRPPTCRRSEPQAEHRPPKGPSTKGSRRRRAGGRRSEVAECQPFSFSIINCAASDGFIATGIPSSPRNAFLSAADSPPSPPSLTMAPAWPICLPSGASKPAM